MSNVETKPQNEWRGDAGYDESVEHERDLTTLAAAYVPDSPAEKALVRKIDKRIIPIIWLLYTMSYLDRANIGNAKTGGLERDFGLTSEQYSVILLVFFISYVLFEIPSNLLIAKVRPSLYLSALCVIWGGVGACMAATHNWQQLAATRFALGVAEAGFSPGVAFYLSSWYKRYEIARRWALYYTATAVSGAFSGLLAGVITQNLDGARGLAGWRWLFLIEGVGASFVGLWSWMILPDYPTTTKWLTQEERDIASQRLAYDGLANAQSAEGHLSEWEACKICFRDWRVWAFVVMYMLSTGAQTIQYFVPTLIGSLGWRGYIGQYYTIPLYACAFVFILVGAFAADHWKNKALFITLFGSVGTLCFIIIVAVSNNYVKYVFMILGLGCIYTVCPLTLIWVPNVIAFPAQKRAVAIALVNALGNSASIYGVFLWPARDAPRYVPGFVATTLFMAIVSVLAQVMNIMVKKYPQVMEDPDAVVQRQLAMNRAQHGQGVGEIPTKQDV